MATVAEACRALRRCRQMDFTAPARTGCRNSRLRQAVERLEERQIERDEVDLVDERSSRVQLLYFVPFGDFYGGWLVYRAAGTEGTAGTKGTGQEPRLYRQYLGNRQAREMGVQETDRI